MSSGSIQWELLPTLQGAKKPFLWYLLSLIEPVSELELQAYQFYLGSDKKHLPSAGGYLDQKASMMSAFRRLDRAKALIDEINGVNDKAREQEKVLNKMINEVNQYDKPEN